MGKDKNRTKGNLKPSSSGRTAEILFKSQEGGFSGGFSTSIHDPEGPDSPLSTDVKFIIRKLSKKDSTTKIKALTELLDLLSSEVSEDTSTSSTSSDLLPYWARIYSKIASDDSRKVRELSHSILSQLGNRVGRKLALQLKLLAPTWFLSQFDIFAPCASAATAAFNSIFYTEQKRKDALVFCHDDLVGPIKGFITSSAFSWKKTDPSGDSSEPYELRMIYSALLGLKKLLELQIPSDEFLTEILENQRFWKISANENILIRRSFYDLISTFVQHKTELCSNLPGISTELNRVIEHALKIEGVDGLNSLWNAIIVCTIEGIWGKTELAKSHLLQCCRKGFFGMASSLAPAVLPMIAKIGIDEKFAKGLLQAIENGYWSERSIKEQNAILTTYTEVFAFFASQNENSEEILNSQLFPLFNLLMINGGQSVIEFGGKIGTLVKQESFYKAFANHVMNSSNSESKIETVECDNESTPKETPTETLPEISSKGDGEASKKKVSLKVAEKCRKNGFYTKNFGYFISSICQNQMNRRKSVKFMSTPNEEKSTCGSGKLNYGNLGDIKKEFLLSLSKWAFGEFNALPCFGILSREFASKDYYEDIFKSPVDVNDWMTSTIQKLTFSSAFEEAVEMKNMYLIISLDLIKTFPSNSSFYENLLKAFESFYLPSTVFPQLLKEISVFLAVQVVQKWCKNEKFIMKLNEELENPEVLRFVLSNGNLFLVPTIQTFLANLTQLTTRENLKLVNKISNIIYNVLVEEEWKGEVKFEGFHHFLPLLDHLCKLHFQSLLHHSFKPEGDEEGENDGKEGDRLAMLFHFIMEKKILSRSHLYQILLSFLESCNEVRKIEKLIEVAKSFLIDDPDLFVLDDQLQFENWSLENSKLQNFTIFLHVAFNSSTINSETPMDFDYLFNSKHLIKSVFDSKIALWLLEEKNEENGEFSIFVTTLNVLYVLSMCDIWAKYESSKYTKTLLSSIHDELLSVFPNLVERLAIEKKMKEFGDNVEQKYEKSNDAIWTSRVPLDIYLSICKKLDLDVPLMPDEFLLLEEVSVSDERFILYARKIFTYILRTKFENSHVQTNGNLNKIIKYLSDMREANSETFGFNRLYKDISWAQKISMFGILQLTIEILRIYTEMKEPPQGGFHSIVTCWISGWLLKTKYFYNITPAKEEGPVVNNAVIKLYNSQLLWIMQLGKATSLINKIVRSCKFAEFTVEFIEFHSVPLYQSIYALYDQLAQMGPNFHAGRCSEAICEVLALIPSPTLSFIEPLPVKIATAFTNTLRKRSEVYFKLSSYKVLKKIKSKPESGNDEEDLPLIPYEMHELIREYSKKLETLEGNIEENKEAWITYLLTWDALLTIQSTNEFASFVKEEHLLPTLLGKLIFVLLPHFDNDPKNYFDTKLQIAPSEVPSLCHLTFAVLLRTLRVLPYVVRWWWNTQLTRQRDKVAVEKFVVRYLSARLAAEELGKVTWNDADNVTVQSLPGCNELVARYKIEETSVTLTISLPLNHPLGPVTVKISDKKLHARISHLLNARSHSLAAGLKLWKENLDGVYKDVDECAICFFVLHHLTKQLPKIACKICKKKFHAACLYKWFNTSNKSECPLCRNIF